MGTPAADDLWAKVAAAVRAQLSEATWNTWFQGVHALDCTDDAHLRTVAEAYCPNCTTSAEHLEREGRKLPRLNLGYRLADALLKLPGLEWLTREQRSAIAYVNHLSFFSSRNTLELLDGTGIACPHIETYLELLIDYVKAESRRRKNAEPRRNI